MKQRMQTFNDGSISFYQVGNTAEPGNTPRQGLSLRAGPFRFDEKTVGMSRFWIAKQQSVHIEKLVRIQRQNAISTEDIAIIDGTQYEITQIQYPEEVMPKVMDISLERSVKEFGIT